MIWRFLIFTRFGRALVLAGALLAAVGMVYWSGRRDERQRAAQRARDAYIATRRALDTAKEFNDVETARDYLRYRAR